jgi:hypothetical protein
MVAFKKLSTSKKIQFFSVTNVQLTAVVRSFITYIQSMDFRGHDLEISNCKQRVYRNIMTTEALTLVSPGHCAQPFT